MFSRRRDGLSLRPIVDGPAYEGKTNGRVYYIDTSAILNDDKLHVFVTNRSLGEPASLRVRFADRDIVALEDGELLTGPDVKAANSFEQPDVIRARSFGEVQILEGEAVLELPPISVAAVTFQL